MFQNKKRESCQDPNFSKILESEEKKFLHSCIYAQTLTQKKYVDIINRRLLKICNHLIKMLVLGRFAKECLVQTPGVWCLHSNVICLIDTIRCADICFYYTSFSKLWFSLKMSLTWSLRGSRSNQSPEEKQQQCRVHHHSQTSGWYEWGTNTDAAFLKK